MNGLLPEPPASPEWVVELRGCAIEDAANPGRPGLTGVDWSVAAGDFWVVGGLPGSGKTLLLETAAGLRAAAAGSVRLMGRAVADLGERAARELRREVGFVYADGGRLLSHLTLAQNIGLPICYHRDCDADTISEELGRLLDAFGLASLARRLPGQVNPAFRERAALARALALRPRLLFLDDPLGALNTVHVRWWLEFLGGTDIGWERPETVVVATDDLRPWLPVAGRFALIQDGRWQVLGGREELAASRGSLLRELLAESGASG